jgi:hypothetical protein
MAKKPATETSEAGSDTLTEVTREVTRSLHFNEENLDRFLCVIEKSARQWQIIVYPSMVAFVVLAAFGFYLIYSLTGDIRSMARAIDPNMGHHMARMTDSMQKMSVNIHNMSSDIRSLPPMLSHIEKLDGSVHDMVGETQKMNQSMHHITFTNEHMRRSMATMTNSVRPMSMFNNFMPW